MSDLEVVSVSVVELVRTILFAAALMLVCLSWLAWRRRRQAPQARILIGLTLSAAIYSFGYAVEVAQTTRDGAAFWLHVEYLGLPWIPTLWLLMARKHNGIAGRTWTLFVVPVVTLAAQFSNDSYGLYDRRLEWAYAPFCVVQADRGPVAWLFLVYAYGAMLYGAWIYVSKLRGASGLLRRRGILLAVSVFPPLAGNFIFVAGWSPWGLDLAPVMLSATSVLAYYAIVRLECMDIVPMARSLVFNNMRDAVLVTDLDCRLVALNPAASRILPGIGPRDLGREIPAEIIEVGSLGELFEDPSRPREVKLKIAGVVEHFEVRIFPLCVEGQQLGWAVLWADISAQMRLVHALRHDAETDELTGVANRRGFLGASTRERARSLRVGVSFAVLVFDVDLFKSINDKFGHGAGDEVLSEIAERASGSLRKEDLLSRLGGDEFAVLLPGADQSCAYEVAERIRDSVASRPILCGSGAVSASVSVGVAVFFPAYPVEVSELIEVADQALYNAKSGGRNQVCV